MIGFWVSVKSKLTAAFGATAALVFVAGLILFAVLMTAGGSIALERWTNWPDILTIPIMLALMVFMPPVAFVLGIIGWAMHLM